MGAKEICSRCKERWDVVYPNSYVVHDGIGNSFVVAKKTGEEWGYTCPGCNHYNILDSLDSKIKKTGKATNWTSNNSTHDGKPPIQKIREWEGIGADKDFEK